MTIKRLKFIKKDFKTLVTDKILCERDVLQGLINITNEGFSWAVLNSRNQKIAYGTEKTVTNAKKEVKICLKNNGASISKEFRKYKI